MFDKEQKIEKREVKPEPVKSATFRVNVRPSAKLIGRGLVKVKQYGIGIDYLPHPDGGVTCEVTKDQYRKLKSDPALIAQKLK
jgi:hypothetical protein